MSVCMHRDFHINVRSDHFFCHGFFFFLTNFILPFLFSAPTRRAGFAVPAARKQSLNEANEKKLILPKGEMLIKKIMHML